MPTDAERLDLEAIKKRLALATPGPWYRIGPPWNDGQPWINAGSQDPHRKRFICDLDDMSDWGDDDESTQGRSITGDADFVAGARSDIPALVAEVERLTNRLRGYEFLDEDAALEEDEPEKIDLVQREAELRAHPHRVLVESMADTLQQVNDDDGNGGGSGWYQSLVLACIDQWMRDLTELDWATPDEAERLAGEIEELHQEILRLKAGHADLARMHAEALEHPSLDPNRPLAEWEQRLLDEQARAIAAERDVIEAARAWRALVPATAVTMDARAQAARTLAAAVDALPQPESLITEAQP
jgi:hypothetical protein